jgi:hypothetical protein
MAQVCAHAEAWLLTGNSYAESILQEVHVKDILPLPPELIELQCDYIYCANLNIQESNNATIALSKSDLQA